MNQLSILTFIIGPVDTWLKNVISVIFLEETTLALFYGNGGPFFVAHHIFM